MSRRFPRQNRHTYTPSPPQPTPSSTQPKPPVTATVELSPPPPIVKTTEKKIYLKIGNKYLQQTKIAYMESVLQEKFEMIRIYFTGMSKEMGYIEIVDQTEVASLKQYMKDKYE